MRQGICLQQSDGWLAIARVIEGSHREETSMGRVRVHAFSMSIDGYGAGPDQGVDNPLGINGHRLHEWIFKTRYGRAMTGGEDGETGIDNDLFARRDEGIGATIMGRNMYGPIRGPWGDSQWTGWWGSNPPFRHPVFVLSHYPHRPVDMEGGTTFHFVDDGIESALERARAAAEGRDVLIGGGAATIRQYLEAGLIDELYLVIVPVLLGKGERLFHDLDVGFDDYECVEHLSSPAVTHIRLAKVATGSR